MPSVRLKISGLVQGVGFRYAMRSEASRRGLSGWVRNRRDGGVEALVQGEPAAVESLVEWARRGPPGARVDALLSEPADGEPAAAGFDLRPTV